MMKKLEFWDVLLDFRIVFQLLPAASKVMKKIDKLEIKCKKSFFINEFIEVFTEVLIEQPRQLVGVDVYLIS